MLLKRWFLVYSETEAVFSRFFNRRQYSGSLVDAQKYEEFHQQAFRNVNDGESAFDHPQSLLLQPVYEKLKDPDSTISGMLICIVPVRLSCVEFCARATLTHVNVRPLFLSFKVGSFDPSTCDRGSKWNLRCASQQL